MYGRRLVSGVQIRSVLALAAVASIVVGTHLESYAVDHGSPDGVDQSTCSFDPPWLDCLQVRFITAGAICGCVFACGSSPTNPFSAVACYGCLFGVGAWESTLGPDVRNCVCWRLGQGHATASGECSGRGTEPPTVPFCPYNPGVAWCKNDTRISDSDIFRDCINEVERSKRRGDFDGKPQGTFGACIARCYNNTITYAKQTGCSRSQPTYGGGPVARIAGATQGRR